MTSSANETFRDRLSRKSKALGGFLAKGPKLVFSGGKKIVTKLASRPGVLVLFAASIIAGFAFASPKDFNSMPDKAYIFKTEDIPEILKGGSSRETYYQLRRHHVYSPRTTAEISCVIEEAGKYGFTAPPEEDKVQACADKYMADADYWKDIRRHQKESCQINMFWVHGWKGPEEGRSIENCFQSRITGRRAAVYGQPALAGLGIFGASMMLWGMGAKRIRRRKAKLEVEAKNANNKGSSDTPKPPNNDGGGDVSDNAKSKNTDAAAVKKQKARPCPNCRGNRRNRRNKSWKQRYSHLKNRRNTLRKPKNPRP